MLFFKISFSLIFWNRFYFLHFPHTPRQEPPYLGHVKFSFIRTDMLPKTLFLEVPAEHKFDPGILSTPEWTLCVTSCLDPALPSQSAPDIWAQYLLCDVSSWETASLLRPEETLGVTIQFPTQNRGSSVFRPGSWGPWSILTSKYPGSEILYCSEQFLTLHGCSQRRNIFLFSQSDTALFQIMIIAFHYPTMQVSIEIDSLF